ncbi:hypothetical protein [Epilithonimonas sp.]|uniref:hypothetical protein n=1 Tax=Epilithonimonas sp. TaxID=2894511 RepID=UPI0035AF7AF0
MSWFQFFKPGADVIKLITYPFVKYLNLPFWSGFLLFSLISSIGIIYLWKIIVKLADGNQKLLYIGYLLLVLPNLHFWTSIIGKEAILFVPIVFICYGILNNNNYFSYKYLLLLIIISIIRPHVAIIFLLVFITTIFITQTLSRKIKFLILSFCLLFLWLQVILLYQLQDFSGGLSRIIHKYEAHIEYFKKTSGYVPLDQYSIFYKFFTFYFRPLPYDKGDILYRIVSVENSVWLTLSFVGAFGFLKFYRILIKDAMFVFSISFLLLIGIMYVFAYANFGIILRTKLMGTPFFYIIIMKTLSLILAKKSR